MMKARDPLTDEWKYFIDKCLPCGASISCALFQRFSDALCHLIEYRVGRKKSLTNYLDDFLFIALTIALCNGMIRKFLDLCDEIGVPISIEKTEWVSDVIVFLGILLDGRNLVLSIPLEKRQLAVSLLREISQKWKATVKELQRLCGYLNFIGKAVFTGRTFTRRMYAKYSKVVNVTAAPKNAYEHKLRQHHHVTLDTEF